MKLKILYLTLPIVIAFGSCKKDKYTSLNVSSIYMINAAPNIAAIKVNVSGKVMSWGNFDPIGYNGSKFYYGPIGIMPITAVAAEDTTKLLFNSNITLQNKVTYSMYIFGTNTIPDTMFRAETNFPYIPIKINSYSSADSVTNVRFVNLSPGTAALNINIKNSSINEASNLTYKGITPFKAYTNNKVTATNYVFEIRNAVTNMLMTTYTFSATPTNQFRNVALIITGAYGTPSFGVFPVNYF